MPSYMPNLFGRSPIRPLQEHMSKVHACVTELTPLIDAVIANDQDKVASVRKDIATKENEADELKWQLRHHLPTGLRRLVLPAPDVGTDKREYRPITGLPGPGGV